MFRGVWKFQPRCPCPEPPLCFQLQPQLLRSRLNLTINHPVHPPTLILQPMWSFLEEKKHKQREFSSQNGAHCQPQATVGRDLLSPPPGLTKNSTPVSQPLKTPLHFLHFHPECLSTSVSTFREIPIFARCSSPGSWFRPVKT
ncbi:hypothetical protein AMECASPLE_037557 [Ameca splendens]|uniref:Uncharacterized protein n=1 Tax=Ameca splendens TaxID=208324 RepID=A0ABV0YWK8_9TELE